MNRNLPNVDKVIRYQIRSLGNQSPLDYEDMYQIGYIGYLKAQKNYKEEYGKMTLEYASRYIRWEILDAIKKEKLRRGREVHIADDEDIVFTENYPQPDTTSDAMQYQDKLEEIKLAITKLSPIEQEIMEVSYLDKHIKDLSFIATKYNKRIETIYYIKSNAMKKLKQILAVK